MSKFIDIVNIINGLSTNMKIFLVIVVAAIVLTKMTPGENKDQKS